MGHLNVVSYLLDEGADINAKTKDEVRFHRSEDEMTAMLMASRYGHIQVVKHLHQNGADLNFKNSKNETACHD